MTRDRGPDEADLGALTRRLRAHAARAVVPAPARVAELVAAAAAAALEVFPTDPLLPRYLAGDTSASLLRELEAAIQGDPRAPVVQAQSSYAEWFGALAQQELRFYAWAAASEYVAGKLQQAEVSAKTAFKHVDAARQAAREPVTRVVELVRAVVVPASRYFPTDQGLQRYLTGERTASLRDELWAAIRRIQTDDRTPPSARDDLRFEALCAAVAVVDYALHGHRDALNLANSRASWALRLLDAAARQPPPPPKDVAEAVTRIRVGLRRATGRAWSVRRQDQWIAVHATKDRRVNGYPSAEDQALLGRLFGAPATYANMSIGLMIAPKDRNQWVARLEGAPRHDAAPDVDEDLEVLRRGGRWL